MITSGEFYKDLQLQLDKQLPFVAYRGPALPGTTKALLQQDTNLYKIEDYREKGFVFAPFDNTKNAVLIPTAVSRILETGVEGFETGSGSKNINLELSGPSAEKEGYQKLVQKGIDAIKNGILKKVVISRKEVLEISNFKPLLIFQRLLQSYPTAFVYCWFHPEVGLWLGATPETLLEVERSRFKTMALAGTRPYEGTTDVTWGEKEKEEQQIVADSILENLKLLTEKIYKSGPVTVKAGNLLHLRTDITGILNSNFQIRNSSTDTPPGISIPEKDCILSEESLSASASAKPTRTSTTADAGYAVSADLGKLISAIHPTPAISGHPKEASKEFILENENYNREFYTGFLGELNMKKSIQRSNNKRNRENQAYSSVVEHSALFVNLRCMKLLDKQAVLFIGGGITKDSDPEAEWEETRNKAQTMKAVLTIP